MVPVISMILPIFLWDVCTRLQLYLSPVVLVSGFLELLVKYIVLRSMRGSKVTCPNLMIE